MEKTYLYSRKHNGSIFKFYRIKDNLWTTGEEYVYIMVETPENAFGYTDTVLLHQRNGIYTEAYTLHRYLPKWILARLFKQMLKAQSKYC